ncbi:MAG: TetR family transcriptional regulator [Victivallaceae bacterium]|nr:TetR family transcriptional regulator [Victivallaceae bacterium]
MQERAVKTRDRILKTSQHLFACHGYHGVSVDRIAAESGANKQRIYEYFKNKKCLLESCLVKSFAEAGKEEISMLKQISDDCSNMTSVILKHYMRLHKKHPDFWKLISWVNLEEEPFYKCLKNIKDDSYSKLSIYYRKGQENGSFQKDLSFEEYMFFLFAVTYFYHSNRKTLSNTLNTELFAAHGADRIINKCVTMLSKV